MAGYDCVALDMVASELIGIDPLKVPTTKPHFQEGSGPGIRNLQEYLWRR